MPSLPQTGSSGTSLQSSGHCSVSFKVVHSPTWANWMPFLKGNTITTCQESMINLQLFIFEWIFFEKWLSLTTYKHTATFKWHWFGYVFASLPQTGSTSFPHLCCCFVHLVKRLLHFSKSTTVTFLLACLKRMKRRKLNNEIINTR